MRTSSLFYLTEEIKVSVVGIDIYYCSISMVVGEAFGILTVCLSVYLTFTAENLDRFSWFLDECSLFLGQAVSKHGFSHFAIFNPLKIWMALSISVSQIPNINFRVKKFKFYKITIFFSFSVSPTVNWQNRWELQIC